NNQGLISAVTNVYGVLQTNCYDQKNRLTKSVDASGITNSFTYDILNRALTQVYADGGIDQFAYGPIGLIAYTNQINQFVHFGYDAAGRIVAITNANNGVTQF